MNEDALVQLSEELLKNGLISIIDLIKLLNERSDNKRYLHLRNVITGKYTSFLQQDIPNDILKDICKKRNIKLDTDVHIDPDTGRPIIRFTVDNKKLPELYNDLYQDAVTKNTETIKILDKYNIPYTLENVSCLHRVDDSKTAETQRLKYTQKINIDERYKDSLSEIFELQDKSPYLVFGTPENYGMSFAAEVLQSKLQYPENRTTEMNELLNHNIYDVAYDLESDCIIINADRSEIEPFINRYTPTLQENIIYAKDREIFEQYLAHIPDKVLDDSEQELAQDYNKENNEENQELELDLEKGNESEYENEQEAFQKQYVDEEADFERELEYEDEQDYLQEISLQEQYIDEGANFDDASEEIETDSAYEDVYEETNFERELEYEDEQNQYYVDENINFDDASEEIETDSAYEDVYEETNFERELEYEDEQNHSQEEFLQEQYVDEDDVVIMQKNIDKSDDLTTFTLDKNQTTEDNLDQIDKNKENLELLLDKSKALNSTNNTNNLSDTISPPASTTNNAPTILTDGTKETTTTSNYQKKIGDESVFNTQEKEFKQSSDKHISFNTEDKKAYNHTTDNNHQEYTYTRNKQSTHNTTTDSEKKYSSYTHDEIKETVRKTESNRNLYNTTKSSPDTLTRLMDMSKHHKQATARDDEYVQGQKALARYDNNMTTLFAYGEFKRSNKQDIATFTENVTKGKYTNLGNAMAKNGFKSFNTSDFNTIAEQLSHQIKKTGLDTNVFRLCSKSDLPAYITKNKQKFEILFNTTDKVVLNTMASQVKDIIRLKDNISIQQKLKSQRKPSALFQNAMNKMGDEVEGYRTLDRSVQTVRQSQRALYHINQLRIDLTHKQYQNKIRRYQEKIATKTSKIQTNNDLIEQALNPSYKKKLAKKNENYEKYVKKLEQRKINRSKQLNKLNEYQNQQIAKNTKKGLRGLARKEQNLKSMETKIKLKQSKTFHGPLKTIQENINMYQVNRAKTKFEKDMAAIAAKKTKRATLKNKLSTIKSSVKNTKFGKLVGKVGATATKAAKPIQLFYKLKSQLSKLLTSLIKVLGKGALVVGVVIIIIYLIVLIIMTCYALLSSNMFSLSFRNFSNLTSPMETDFGKIYLELSETEKEWVESIKNTGNGTFKFTDFDDADRTIDWNLALSSVDDSSAYSGYTYQDGVIYADPLGLGKEYSGAIERIDGGGVATFYNVNNNTSLSNLKDILCLLSVYYDDNFSDYTFEGRHLEGTIQDSLANWKTSWSKGVSIAQNTIASILNFAFDCNISTSSYKDYTKELASEKYAISLFEASHEMSVSLYNVSILPTESQADQATLTAAQQGNGFINGTRALCTKKYGCADTGLLSSANGLFYYDSNGSLHAHSASGPTQTNKGQALNTLINTREGFDFEWKKCYSLSGGEREHSRCWYYTIKQVPYEDTYTYIDITTGKPATGTTTKYREEKEWHYNCKGHYGSYCCGHVVIQSSGIIHGLPTAFANGTETAHEGYEPQKKAHNPFVTSTATIDSIDITDDIIDVDTKIEHNFIPSTWIGWTAEKVDWVINRYRLDWQKYYGFNPETSIPTAYTGNVIGMTASSFGTGYYGSATYSSADINEWMEKIKSSYNISPVVEQKLRLGLSYVGKAAYNQGSHGSKFIENGGKGITATDCSGFASNVWYKELGSTIHTCYYLDEWGKQNGKRHPMRDSSGLEPGDIILSMNNKYGGGSSNHAMVYLGTFDGQIYCVESTSSNDGGIFAMARGNAWYTRPGTNGGEIMYYLDMTP